ncbi:MAG: hypothetical protein P8X98_15835 [Woeseiaceae bacterium]|jgi:hypothetical protein
MIRQIGRTLGVTIAFTAGAVCTALILDIEPIQGYLGLASHDVADWYRGGPAYLGIAALTGLCVDAVRFIVGKWVNRRAQASRDIEELFRQSLA